MNERRKKGGQDEANGNGKMVAAWAMDYLFRHLKLRVIIFGLGAFFITIFFFIHQMPENYCFFGVRSLSGLLLFEALIKLIYALNGHFDAKHS